MLRYYDATVQQCYAAWLLKRKDPMLKQGKAAIEQTCNP